MTLLPSVHRQQLGILSFQSRQVVAKFSQAYLDQQRSLTERKPTERLPRKDPEPGAPPPEAKDLPSYGIPVWGARSHHTTPRHADTAADLDAQSRILAGVGRPRGRQ